MSSEKKQEAPRSATQFINQGSAPAEAEPMTMEEIELMQEMNADHILWLKMIEMSVQTYAQKAAELRAQGRFEEANYFKGKCDGFAASLKHFSILKGVRQL